jgi:superfamily I DNA/RNA helicase
MRLPSYQQLSKEQDRINNLPLDGRHLVTGPPGTGKTVMALYRAAMLKRRRRKARLLMYSRLLSQYTESAVDELELDGAVDTFHSWFYGFFRSQYRHPPPSTEPYRYAWDEVLTTIFQAPPRAGSVPDLLVDEGQDLPKEFYTVAHHIAQNIIVFADENQRLMEDNSTIDQIRTYGSLPPPHLLTRNYRNTREIAELAAAFFTGLSTGIPALPDRRGAKPVMRAHTSRSDAAKTIEIFARNNADLEIGVFTPTKKLQNSFWYHLDGKVGMPVQRYVGGQGSNAEKIRFGEPGVTVVNYASAKGLEFDAVFIPELHELNVDPGSTDFRMRMYVLISRARDQLFLSYSGHDVPPIVKAFPKELVEWR